MLNKRRRPLLLNGLALVGWRYFTGHAWQTLLMILGIALGVAVIVAVDIANASAVRAFSLSTEAIAGKATHQITGGVNGLREEVYSDLKRKGMDVAMAPVVGALVSSPQLGERPLQLFGVDPFVDGQFRNYLNPATTVNPQAYLSIFTVPGAVMISAENSARYGLKLGDEISLDIDGVVKTAIISGILEVQDDLSRRTLEGMILADISTVQELTNRQGWLDWVDVILPEGEAVLEEALPAGAALQPVSSRQGALEQMTAAFRANLSALSMLALIVGLFLIYNSITFSVVQRRKLFGILRCLGVTRGEVFRLVVWEAVGIGLIGSLVGIGLGVLMGRNTVLLVSQTINDLYFTTTVQDVSLPLISLLKGGLIGVAATVLAAGFPAFEAASIPPNTALTRSILESKSRLVVILLAGAGLAAILLGVIVFQLSASSMLPGFIGTALVVVGFAMLAAISMIAIMNLLEPILPRMFGFLGRMAPRNVIKNLSRTAVAVAALMVAIAVTIGINLMVDSFRSTVDLWLRQTLQSDVYLTAPSFVSSSSQTPIDPQVVEKVNTWPGVARVDVLRTIHLETSSGYIILSATSNPEIGVERMYVSRSLAVEDIWPAMQQGGLLISETLARNLDLTGEGKMLKLPTPNGEVEMPVLGIYNDYSSSEGGIMMALNVYQDLWRDSTITAIGLRLQPGYQADQITQDLEERLGVTQKLIIRANQELRADVMDVFDRTFTITASLRILATVVAFIGILSTLLLIQLEKQREIGILRALGLTGGQLWRLTMLETGLMGLSAGLLAMPTGYVVTLILIYVINLRSFGWTIQLFLEPRVFVQSLGLAVLAALLAGIYPALRLGRMVTSEAVRYE